MDNTTDTLFIYNHIHYAVQPLGTKTSPGVNSRQYVNKKYKL